MIKSKLRQYAKRYATAYTNSARSDYYQFGSTTLRISDHIGRNSDGSISIIETNDNQYILHKHSNGTLKTISYNDCKVFIRSLALTDSLVLKPLSVEKVEPKVKVEPTSVAPKIDVPLDVTAFRETYQGLNKLQKKTIATLCNFPIGATLSNKALNAVMHNKIALNLIKDFLTEKGT